MPPRQLPLSLPYRASLSRADFLTGAANAEAIALIDAWPNWPARTVLLAGPIGSGKSHLVEIWRGKAGAGVTAAATLAVPDVEALLASGAVAIEDLHAGPIDEAVLFHLLNIATERNAAVLMTSRLWPSSLPLALEDLVSRLRAAYRVELAEPDDGLLRRVLTKLLADRQLIVDRAVVDFVVTRMERSLGTASMMVDRLDQEALAAGRAITVPFAAEVLRPIFEHQGEVRPD
jgi:chromosomal replication initiation ATPase DnaA